MVSMNDDDVSLEVNFDGLVGPTHNYSGLAFGNVASIDNKQSVSNPKAAALQQLEKMWLVASLGIPQGIIPPQERPHIPTLQQLGYTGSDAEIIQKVEKSLPDLMFAVSSASSMWVANAATISPSTDSHDKKVHITPANLCVKFHRAIEVPMTMKFLKTIFPDPTYFIHHPPLPSNMSFSDEGAANHTRFCPFHSDKGVQLFVYGRKAFTPNVYLPSKFPARQTLEASAAISRIHELPYNATVFVQQNPKAIDAGVFHNDVIAVGNNNLLLYHELAFVENEIAIEEIMTKIANVGGGRMYFIKVSNSQVPLQDAISSYLFNSQIITLADGNMTLIAPAECQKTPSVAKYLTELSQDPGNPISQIHYINIRESMRNGGGPACLRLRVVLNKKELAAVNQNFLLNEHLYTKLKAWINKYYRDKLRPQDLFDPQLLVESRDALNALSKILNTGFMYEFQQS